MKKIIQFKIDESSGRKIYALTEDGMLYVYQEGFIEELNGWQVLSKIANKQIY